MISVVSLLRTEVDGNAVFPNRLTDKLVNIYTHNHNRVLLDTYYILNAKISIDLNAIPTEHIRTENIIVNYNPLRKLCVWRKDLIRRRRNIASDYLV